MTLPKLISFSGYAESGKDTLADFLTEFYGYQKTYMSKPLEKALLTLDPWVPDPHGPHPIRYTDLHNQMGYDATKKFSEVRRLLQILGTEIGREMFGENSWLDLVFREISAWLGSNELVTLTGVRYRNELARVREHGGVTVWINRPGYGPVNSHSSDNTLGPDDCMLTILNDGSVAELAGELFGACFAMGYAS